ncbi:MAG: metalloregulator ArsR/SmtB family transcription factor [Gammaproteobacteria bacterium]|nr:metalloregulator ArsR/SmtB family transcription factor [Gammaproteobacteria bacterium]
MIEPKTLFAALAQETRLTCLMLLLKHGELCVCELTQALVLAQPHVSHHLAKLRKDGILLDRRQGLWVHYRLNPELPDWAMGVLREAARAFELPPLLDRPPEAVLAGRQQPPGCA